MKNKLATAEHDRDIWKKRYQSLLKKVGLFLDALKRAPRRVMEFLSDILRQPPEKTEPEIVPEQTREKSRQEAR